MYQYQIQVGDVVRVNKGTCEATGTVVAIHAECLDVSEGLGHLASYDQKDVVRVIKRTNAPQSPRLFRVSAEVFYLVRADSAEQAYQMVAEHPDQHIDYILVEPDDVSVKP